MADSQSIPMDTVWINRSKGQFRLVPKQVNQGQEPIFNVPNPNTAPSQQEINKKKKADKDKPLDEKSIYSLEEELKDILKKTINNDKVVYKAATSYANGQLVDHYYIFDDADNKFKEVDSNGNIVSGAKSLTPSELKKAVENAKSAKEYSTNRTGDNSYENYVKSTGNNAKTLIKAMENGNYKGINSLFEGLNKNNIVDFLDDYYKQRPLIKGSKGLIEFSDDKTDITMDNKKKVINSLLSVAETLGMSNVSEYKELHDIYVEYTSGINKNCKNMAGESKQGKSFLTMCEYVGGGAVSGAVVGLEVGTMGGPIGWAGGLVIGGIVGLATSAVMYCTETGSFSTPSDSKRADELMYALHQKIKARLNQQESASSYVLPSYMDKYQTNPSQNSGVILQQNQPQRRMGVYEA